MMKLFTQGLVGIALFISTLFLLKQVDWMTVFKVEKTTDITEEKLGELIWDYIKKTEIEYNNPFVVKTIDRIVNEICSKNEIDKNTLKVHVVINDEVNAFALPNGHLVIYSGLILASENQEELSGVICHEIAHIQLNHVMKKLISEVGLSVLISMVTGNTGADIIKDTSQLLVSSAFDRSLEKEADIKAVDYLINTKINPEPFANFLYKLSYSEDDAMKYFSWISTHPDSKERAKYILEYNNSTTIEYQTILSVDSWEKLQEKLME